jgi:hypothetical protein
MSELTDRTLHMLKPRGYGMCGVHVGRFTSKVKEVDCPNCIAIIESNKENDSEHSDR